jgi:hypothetical protein
MERDFGKDIARSFGTRLKRAYRLEESALPQQMLACLEQLKKAENELAPGTEARTAAVRARG